ncbi:GNAT family N-acetyltransferase [Candidatus Sumerlaeota bacterium]|nr:GNAT family N-acetyltransferase [Candidatus Sumerlaeales bacterium]NLD61101.1 GNAT family N-acetyltransferase [Candidatus Sumerlaeota bacterium]
MKVISVREHSQYARQAIAYFQKRWATPDSMAVYEDCIIHCIGSDSPLPQWYLLMDDERIVGCAGLITNDFISRHDLWPWICALYIEEADRGHNYAKLLIEQAENDARKAGYKNVYIATDHIGYYEHFGAEYIATGYHPWNDSSRIYRIALA